MSAASKTELPKILAAKKRKNLNAPMWSNVQSSGTAAERDVEWNDDKQIS